ncbi:MAG: ABC transporter permease [Verrucomicrobiales bacterium]|nr:ABC transporter permease [Verrucomicrobiales bacterium]
MLRDLRFALRQFLKQPGFFAVAVLTLSLGIGATTAVFGLVNAVLIQPLPYPNPDRLVTLYETLQRPGASRGPVAAPMLQLWRSQTTAFEGLGAVSGDTFAMTGRGIAENLNGRRLSANLFDILGVTPMFGRGFRSAEETFGNHRVVLISHEFWQRRLGGDTAILGQTLLLNFEPHEVIGVMPPRTYFPEPGIEVWTPLAFTPDQLQQRHAHTLEVFGRLKPGIHLEQARAELDVVSRRLAQSDPENRDWNAEVQTYREVLVAPSRRTLYVLLGSVGFVLLIACVNIANLLLTRSAARTREFAIRTALGAGRWPILRQLLAEGCILSIFGGLGGLALAHAATALIPALAPPELRFIGRELHLKPVVWAVAGTLALTTGVAFGLAPALQTFARASNRASLGSRDASGGQRPASRQILAVAQLSLSLLLLSGAGLLIRSFLEVLSQPAGFNPRNVVTLQIALPEQRYPEQADRTRFFSQLQEKVRALPGVDASGMILGLPLAENQMGTAVEVVDRTTTDSDQPSQAGYAQISPGYFKAMQIPFVAGRNFTADDRAGTPDVVIVDETFAARFGLGPNPLGRRLRLGDGARAAEIIGVVKDVRRHALDRPPQGEVYRAYEQRCWGFMSLVVRSSLGADDIARSVRRVLDDLDPDQPLERVRTLNTILDASVAQRRVSAQLLGAFAVTALGLAALGLYGVLSTQVAQRTAEMGIRMALGAQPSEVQGLVLRQGFRLAVAGLVLGLSGAFALSRFLADLLFSVSALDPVTFGTVSVVLLATALVACWIPGRRASLISPLAALRSE